MEQCLSLISVIKDRWEAREDAEAQAQVHRPQAQVQVSEVRDINNYTHSANSPITVC